MKADAWHRTWFNFGGINRPVSIRELGASELDSPSIVTRLDGTDAVVDLAVGVSNRAGPRTIAVRGTLAGTAVRFDPVHLDRGQRATVRARVRIARPDLWEPGHPTLEPLRLEVPGEAVFTERVGLREVRWAGGRLELNGEALKLRGASLQEDAPGRGDALTDADADAIVARLKAIGANATRSQHPLGDGLLDRLDARRHPRLAGRRPGRRPRRMDLAHARAAAPRHPPRAPERAAGAPAPQRGGLEPRQRGRRQRALRRPAASTSTPPPSSCTASIPAVRRRSTCGVPTCPTRPASCTATSTRWAPRTTRAGTTTRSRPPAIVQGAIDRWLVRLRATFPGKVLIVSEFGAEANRLNAPGTPGSESFQASLLTRHIRSYEATPWLDGELVWNLQDFALAPVVRGRLHPPPGPEHQPRARDQPEGAVHLRRAAQAVGRRGAAGVRGLTARRPAPALQAWLPAAILRRSMMRS